MRALIRYLFCQCGDGRGRRENYPWPGWDVSWCERCGRTWLHFNSLAILTTEKHGGDANDSQ